MNYITYIFVALLSIGINNVILINNEIILSISVLSLYVLPILYSIYILKTIDKQYYTSLEEDKQNKTKFYNKFVKTNYIDKYVNDIDIFDSIEFLNLSSISNNNIYKNKLTSIKHYFDNNNNFKKIFCDLYELNDFNTLSNEERINYYFISIIAFNRNFIKKYINNFKYKLIGINDDSNVNNNHDNDNNDSNVNNNDNSNVNNNDNSNVNNNDDSNVNNNDDSNVNNNDDSNENNNDDSNENNNDDSNENNNDDSNENKLDNDQSILSDSENSELSDSDQSILSENNNSILEDQNLYDNDDIKYLIDSFFINNEKNLYSEIFNKKKNNLNQIKNILLHFYHHAIMLNLLDNENEWEKIITINTLLSDKSLYEYPSSYNESINKILTLC